MVTGPLGLCNNALYRPPYNHTSGASPEASSKATNNSLLCCRARTSGLKPSFHTTNTASTLVFLYHPEPTNLKSLHKNRNPSEPRSLLVPGATPPSTPPPTFSLLSQQHITMADVDMTDAPSGSSAAVRKSVGKSKAGASEGGVDGKKRFEVKKVCDK